MRMKRKLFDRITVNPKVCMGQPTIRGMRITVAFVLKLLASGMSHEEVMKAYPELEEKDILQAIEYASGLQGSIISICLFLLNNNYERKVYSRHTYFTSYSQ